MRQSIPIYGDDYGRIELVQHMGSDQAIIDAARVSFAADREPALEEAPGEGMRGVSRWRPKEDPKLLRYLIKNQHWSPFEHCTITWHIVVPLFVRGQWHRHRTWCVAGDNQLHFDLPGGIERRGSQLYTRTIKEVYEAFHRSGWSRQRIQNMHLRCAINDEDPGHTRIVDIWSNGTKPVIEVQTGHRAFKATKEHRVLAWDGETAPCWVSLGEALERGMDLAVIRPNRSAGEVASDWNGEPRGAAGEDAREHGSLGYLQVQFEQVIAHRPAGEEEVFDLEVEGPDHNFVCEGFVVHNSYNEVSRRYTSEDLRFYEPKRFRPQASKNKQASVWAPEESIDPAIHDPSERMTWTACNVLKTHVDNAVAIYEAMLEAGIAREQARMVLPQNMYVRFYGTVNLRNALAFIQLREDNHAQWEIYKAAEAMREHLENLYPEALKAWDEVMR